MDKIFNIRVYHDHENGNVILKKEDWEDILEVLELTNVVVNFFEEEGKENG